MCEPLLEVLTVKVVRAGIEEKEISQRSLIYLVTSFNFVTSALKPLDYRGERNTDKGTVFAFISELIEENEEDEELSEVEGKNHFKTGENPLSCCQSKQIIIRKEEPIHFSPALSVERV